MKQTETQLDQVINDFKELSRSCDKSQMNSCQMLIDEKLSEMKELNCKLSKHCSDLEEKVVVLNHNLSRAEQLVLEEQHGRTLLQDTITKLEKDLESLPVLKIQVSNVCTWCM